MPLFVFPRKESEESDILYETEDAIMSGDAPDANVVSSDEETVYIFTDSVVAKDHEVMAVTSNAVTDNHETVADPVSGRRMPPKASEEEWQRRIQKRQAHVASIKETPEYLASRTGRPPTGAPPPLP